MHMVWVRAIGGRLEERYRYSIEIIYNNFPWPTVSEKQKQKVEELAQEILNARNRYPSSTYKQLYKIETMPDDLLTAHQNLDKYVARLYGVSSSATDKECLIELLHRYSKLVEQQ